MFEPQSATLFVLLMVLFGVLMWRTLATRRIALRVLGACLVFLPAMAFGVLTVNKYYDYYETWGAAFADFSDQPGPAAATAQAELARVDASQKDLGLAQRQGYTMRLSVTGQRSHITRTVYVYLPPQYFQPAYSTYRFPVIELIHGSPGEPQDWINVVGITKTLVRLVSERLARPAVLLMPDANGARNIDLQCLNQVGGPQDLTYLAADLPDEITHLIRVQPPGPAWGIAGYSSGGYCAANMALRFRGRYGFSGMLSGYYLPSDNQLVNPLRNVNPFGGSYRLAQQNNPLDEIEALRPGAVIPQFWLAAGQGNTGDVQAAQLMLQGLRLLRPHTTLTLTSGVGHDMATWRAEVPSMLEWMTEGLAQAAGKEAAAAQPKKASVLAQGRAHKRGQLVPVPHASASP